MTDGRAGCPRYRARSLATWWAQDWSISAARGGEGFFGHEFFEGGEAGEDAGGEGFVGVGGHGAAEGEGGDAEFGGDAGDAGGGFAVGGLGVHAAFAGDDEVYAAEVFCGDRRRR